MTVRCPRCGSSSTQHVSHITTTTAGIGAFGGIAATLTRAFSAGGAVGGVPFVAGLLVSSLFSGLAGSLLGAKVGSELERSMPDTYRCNSCNNRFNPTTYLN